MGEADSACNGKSAMALWCNGNTSGFDPEIVGSNPARAAQAVSAVKFQEHSMVD